MEPPRPATLEVGVADGWVPSGGKEGTDERGVVMGGLPEQVEGMNVDGIDEAGVAVGGAVDFGPGGVAMGEVSAGANAVLVGMEVGGVKLSGLPNSRGRWETAT